MKKLTLSLSSKMLLIFIAILVFLLLYSNINPLSSNFFLFHDATQGARLDQFVSSFKSGIFPPRFAPEMSFGLSHPMIGLYSPFAYYPATFFNLIGFDIASSLQLTWMMAVFIGFTGCYFFFKNFFDNKASIFGSVVYISSLYWSLDIFVRGNIAETMFLGLLPTVFHFSYIKQGKFTFILTSILMGILFTTHNALSFLMIPILCAWILWISRNKILSFLSLFMGLLLSAYFWLPLVIQAPLTHAKEIAIKTNFLDHFLCTWQLWTGRGPWSFGASMKGCEDGMIFALGKPQIILFILGVFVFILNHLLSSNISSLKSIITSKSKALVFLFLLTVFSLFLTTESSRFIWIAFKNQLELLQFPWRFITLSLLGLAAFSSYFWEYFEFQLTKYFSKYYYKFTFLKPADLFLIFFVTFILLFNKRYFITQNISKIEYLKNFASKDFVKNKSVYHYLELTPKIVDMDTYQNIRPDILNNSPLDGSKYPAEGNINIIKNTPFEKMFETTQTLVTLNIHYFPYWQIKIDDKTYTPKKFDSLGRPLLILNNATKVISISRRYPAEEFFGDIITCLGLLFTILLAILIPKAPSKFSLTFSKKKTF